MVLKSLISGIIKIKIWENKLMSSYLDEHNINNNNRSKFFKMKIIVVTKN